MQVSFTHPLAFFPVDPQVPPGEKTSDSVSCQVVDPALLPQLSHDGVNEGETSPSLRGNKAPDTEYFASSLIVMLLGYHVNYAQRHNFSSLHYFQYKNDLKALSTSLHAARYSGFESQSTWVHTELPSILLKLGMPTLAV